MKLFNTKVFPSIYSHFTKAMHYYWRTAQQPQWKKHTSNCIYQSSFPFLRLVEMQLSSFFWALTFLYIKLRLKMLRWLETNNMRLKAFKITLYYSIQYTFPVNDSNKRGINFVFIVCILHKMLKITCPFIVLIL